MYTESYEIMLKRYELDRDELVLKKRQLILKGGNDLQMKSLDEKIAEDDKCIAWVSEQIKQGKIRPNG